MLITIFPKGKIKKHSGIHLPLALVNITCPWLRLLGDEFIPPGFEDGLYAALVAELRGKRQRLADDPYTSGGYLSAEPQEIHTCRLIGPAHLHRLARLVLQLHGGLRLADIVRIILVRYIETPGRCGGATPQRPFLFSPQLECPLSG